MKHRAKDVFHPGRTDKIKGFAWKTSRTDIEESTAILVERNSAKDFQNILVRTLVSIERQGE